MAKTAVFKVRNQRILFLTISGAAFLAALQLAEKFFLSESAWMT